MKRGFEQVEIDQQKHVLNVTIPDLATTDWIKFSLESLNSNNVQERIKCLLALSRHIFFSSTEQQQSIVQALIYQLDIEIDHDTKVRMYN